MIGIYKITNLINNKSYIGQAQNIKQRFLEHRYAPFYAKSSQYHSIFYKAIRKYGIDNFSFEVLEECKIEELDEKEKYWISFYNTFIGWEDSKGYNMTIGGHGKRKVDQAKILKLWEEGYCPQNIGNILSISRETVKKYLYDGNISWRDILKKSSESRGKAVSQYSLDGRFLRTFPTIALAVESLKPVFPNAAVVNICSACSSSKASTTAYGYIWKYNNDETPIKELVQKANSVLHHRDCPVYQFNLKGEYIRSFPTIKEAALSCDIKCHTSITNACTGRSNSAGGYIWSYSKDLPVERTKIKSNTRRGYKGKAIAQYDLNGKLVKIYTDRQEAAAAINGKPKGISNVCCGDKKTYKGYIWKFIDQQ